MNLEELRKYKPQIEEIAQKYGVTDIRVFGSVARGDAREDSDVDLLANFPKGTTYFDLFDIKKEIEDTIDNKIDLLSYNGVNKYMKDDILKESMDLDEK